MVEVVMRWLRRTAPLLAAFACAGALALGSEAPSQAPAQAAKPPVQVLSPDLSGGAIAAPSEPVPWGTIITIGAVALLGLAAGGAALYFTLWSPPPLPRDPMPEPDSPPPPGAASDALALVRREINQLRQRFDQELAEAGELRQLLRDLRLDHERLLAQVDAARAAAPRAHAAPLRSPPPSAGIVADSGFGTSDRPFVTLDEPFPNSRSGGLGGLGGSLRGGPVPTSLHPAPPAALPPVHHASPMRVPRSTPPASTTVTPKRLVDAFQQAAASALGEVACEDPIAFTQAVVARLPVDLRRGAQAMLFSAHSSAVDLAQTFHRPDFFSVKLPNGEVWLLPNPTVDYGYNHSMFYDGAGWPRVSKPALCTIDGAGRAALQAKGQLE